MLQGQHMSIGHKNEASLIAVRFRCSSRDEYWFVDKFPALASLNTFKDFDKRDKALCSRITIVTDQTQTSMFRRRERKEKER